MSFTKLTVTRQLGANGPKVSAIGLGCLENAMATMTYAADRGVTFWDTSDVYSTSEDVIGKWFLDTGRRQEIFLCTKFGAFDLEQNLPKLNSKPDYIRRRIQSSLKRLNTDYIDLYYQHRTDPEVPIEVVMNTLKPFLEEGTLKWIGLSECSASTVQRAKAVGGIIAEKLVVTQMEYSPLELSLETTGFTNLMKEQGMAIAAYSPLSRGLISGRYNTLDDMDEKDIRRTLPRFSPENFHKNVEVVEKLRAIGEKYNVSAAQVTLAWILAEHPNFIPIPGCRSIERLEENARSAELELRAEDVQEIRAVVDSANVSGERYPAFIMQSLQQESLPLSEWQV
ncbi:Aldo/keto reductase [Flagelloscypha sp. PMI_526]|nr:Aldo/keto reductase [Flagelloscypha sp. PMI_526]